MFGALSLAGVLTCGELYLRITRPNNDLKAFTGARFRANPARVWAVTDAYAAYAGRPGTYPDAGHKTINAHGFISTPAIDVAKVPGTIRIAFFGGSSTAGTGYNLDDEQTWPWKTVVALRGMFPDRKIELINAALGGYASFESFGRLWSRVRFFSPDIVVLCHGWNEMSYFREGAVQKLHRRRTLPDGSWSLDRTGGPIRLYEPLAIDPWIGWSQLLTRTRLRLTRPVQGELGGAPPRHALADTWDHRALDTWRTNVQLIREACKTLGMDLFVVKQPTLIVPDLSPEQRHRCRYEYHGFNHEAHVEAFTAVSRVIDEEIEADRVIDATTMSGIPEMFFDHVHPTEKGTTELARIVTAALAPRMASPTVGRTSVTHNRGS